jgi:hypothetical protein
LTAIKQQIKSFTCRCADADTTASTYQSYFLFVLIARASPVVMWRWDGQLWVEGGEEGAYGAGNFNYDGIVHRQNSIQFG